jgi:hypothetical protein
MSVYGIHGEVHLWSYVDQVVLYVSVAENWIAHSAAFVGGLPYRYLRKGDGQTWPLHKAYSFHFVNNA